MNDKTIPPKNRVAIIKGLEFKSALAHSEVWQTALKHAAEDADSEVREAAKKAVEYIK
jgi:hypothetical protein